MNKQANSQKKTSDLYFSESEKWNLMKAIKTYRLLVINKYQGCDVRHDTYRLPNAACEGC